MIGPDAETDLGNFSGIPSPALRVEVEHLINTLSANRGLYDTHIFSDAIHALRMSVQRTSQAELRRRD